MVAYAYGLSIGVPRRQQTMAATVVIPYHRTHGYYATVTYGYFLIADDFHLPVDESVANTQFGVFANLYVRAVTDLDLSDIFTPPENYFGVSRHA